MSDDWRLQNQGDYLTGQVFEWRPWSTDREDWDHDHCSFCWIHFADHVLSDDAETQLEGWVTIDGKHWVRGGCFDDFRDKFSFQTSAPSV
jgi:hypothetical protein